MSLCLGAGRLVSSRHTGGELLGDCGSQIASDMLSRLKQDTTVALKSLMLILYILAGSQSAFIYPFTIDVSY